MSLLIDYWFIAIPFGIELLSFTTMVVLSKWIYPRLATRPSPEPSDNEGKVPSEGSGWQHMDEQGRPRGSYAWVRVIELVIIVYHFPVIVPTAAVRKDNSVPAWVMYVVTPALYSGVLYWFFGRHQG